MSRHLQTKRPGDTSPCHLCPVNKGEPTSTSPLALGYSLLGPSTTACCRRGDYAILLTVYFGEIKNKLFFKNENTLPHVAYALLRVVSTVSTVLGTSMLKRKDLPIGTIQCLSLSSPSTINNSRPRYCKKGVFLKRKIDSWQQD